MSIRISTFDTASSAAWRGALARFQPQDDVYFSPGYHTSAALLAGAVPACILAEKGGQALLLPYLHCAIPEAVGRWDVQSAYGYGGPLALHADADFLEAAWQAIFARWTDEGAVAAFLRCHPLEENAAWLRDAWRVIPDRPTVTVDLRGGIEGAFGGPERAKHRRDVQKAARCGYCWKEAPEFETHLDEFIARYNQSMQRLGASEFYFFPRHYFESLFKDLRGQASFVVVEHVETREIGAMGLAMWGRRWAHYHLGTGSVAVGGLNLTHALMQGIAETAACRGCESLHLGGGRTAASDDRLLQFKQWIGQPTGTFYLGAKVLDTGVYEALNRDFASRNHGQPPNWFLGYRQPSRPPPVAATTTL